MGFASGLVVMAIARLISALAQEVIAQQHRLLSGNFLTQVFQW